MWSWEWPDCFASGIPALGMMGIEKIIPDE